MFTSEVLNGAADRIERFGHHKGSGYGEGSALTAPACMIGAVNAALYVHTGAWDNRAALAAVREHIGPSIVDWNDAPERTAAEVIEVLRAAAVIEAAREEQDAAWETYAEQVSA